MRRIFRLVLLGCLVLAVARPAAAQESDDRSATETRLRQLQQQIADDQKRLSETVEAEEATVKTLDQLDRQIALRTELIRNYRRRVREITHESDSLRTSMSTLEADLERLKDQYQGRASHVYKYGRMHDLALILAARSINEMLIRVQYLRRFAQQRRDQLNEILATGATLRKRRAELDAMLKRNRDLLQATQQEQQRLANDQSRRRDVVDALRKQKTTIQQSIDEKRASAGALEERLRQLAATASSRQRVREETNPALAAEFAELTGSFRENKGNLPWPADGVVRESFGNIKHPVYGTLTPNYGILIDTPASAEVHAVFEGIVSDISILPEYGTYLTIEHGDYISIYANFSLTYVTEGDHVKAGQVIGRAGTDSEPKGRAVFFALFSKDQSFFDPVPWLRRR